MRFMNYTFLIATYNIRGREKDKQAKTLTLRICPVGKDA